MNLKKSRLLSLATSILVMSASLVGISAGAANAASAPVTVTFEANDTSGAALSGTADFGGNASSVVTSTVGANTSQVGKIVNGADCYSGTTFLKAPFGNQLISSTSYLVSLDLYSTVPVSKVKFKLEGGGGDPAREVDLAHTGSGWETLTFDFGAGTAVAPGNYINASLFVGFSCPDPHDTTGEVFYFDNVSFPGATTPDVVTPRTTPLKLVNFEANDTSGYTAGGTGNFGGAVASKSASAPAGGSLGSTQALKVISQGECWAGTTFMIAGEKESLVSAGNTTVTANLYAPAAGKEVMFKLESSITTGAAVEARVTTVQGWQTVSLNFGAYNPAIDYNKASVFPDFTCVSGTKVAGAEYY
ncbi:MAG: hypothetical protein ACOYJ7_05860, partial [Rhodoluna sp.]